MSELGRQISARVARTTESLAAAQAAEDDYLASVLYGELESLARVADEHDLDVPGLRDALQRHGSPTEVHLPDTGGSALVLDLSVGTDEAERRIA